MKMNEPIGNSIYGPLLLRVPLGAYFVMAGLYKLDRPHLFIDTVKQFRMLPDTLAILYGVLLPYIEVAAGCLIILGLYTTLAALFTSLMLLSFVVAVGPFSIKPDFTRPFNKDLILLGASISLLYTGAGAFSIDRFRKSG